MKGYRLQLLLLFYLFVVSTSQLVQLWGPDTWEVAAYGLVWLFAVREAHRVAHYADVAARGRKGNR